jgi:NAD kinase
LKRPLLIPPHLHTELMLKGGENLTLTLDGHATFALETGQSLRITKSPFPFIMVKARARDYFEVLKEKLGLL